MNYTSRQICITTAAGQKYIIPIYRLSKVISVGAPNKLLARTLGCIINKTRQGFIDHPYLKSTRIAKLVAAERIEQSNNDLNSSKCSG